VVLRENAIRRHMPATAEQFREGTCRRTTQTLVSVCRRVQTTANYQTKDTSS